MERALLAFLGVYLSLDGHDGGQQPGYFFVSGGDAGVFKQVAAAVQMGGKAIGFFQLPAAAEVGASLFKGIFGDALPGIADDFISLPDLLFPGIMLGVAGLPKPDALLSGRLVNHSLLGGASPGIPGASDALPALPGLFFPRILP